MKYVAEIESKATTSTRAVRSVYLVTK